MKRIPTDIDRNLWFHHRGCKGRHYLIGNPHTVPGRLYAWCPIEQSSLFLACADISSMSKLARYWVAGFLHGNEPDPPPGEDGPPDFGSPPYKKWQRQALQFRKTGVWKSVR